MCLTTHRECFNNVHIFKLFLNELAVCSTLFLRAHEHIYFMECALSQNVLLPLLMVHFVTRMYYYYYYNYIFLHSI